MTNPRSAYVRRKQARKACIHCGGHEVEAFNADGTVMFSCRDCWTAFQSGNNVPWTWAYSHTILEDEPENQVVNVWRMSREIYAEKAVA